MELNYILKRLKDKAEEYGIKVVEVSERKTSSICPRCLSKNGRLFKCLSCNLEGHRDAIGVLNIARLDGGEVKLTGCTNLCF